MFDLSFSEILVVAVVGLLVVGPDELPALIKKGRSFINQVKEMGNDFTKTIMGDEDVVDLKKEVEKLNNDMKVIIDLEGKPQPTYDISDIMQEMKKAPSAPKNEDKTT